MLSAWDMERKIRSPSGRPAGVNRLVWELTGKILDAKQRLHLSDEQLAKTLGLASLSTLYGYRNGSRKSPSLLEFSSLAEAVGLTLDLTDGTELAVGPCERPHMKTEQEEDIIGWMRALPTDADRAELRRIVRRFYLSRTSGSRLPMTPAEQAE